MFVVIVATRAARAEGVCRAGSTQPSPSHRVRASLGTDQLGRDMPEPLDLRRAGSLLVGFVVQIVILAIGVPVGLVAGYFPARSTRS